MNEFEKQLVKLGYKKQTDDWFGIKKWIWDNHKIEIRQFSYSETLDVWNYKILLMEKEVFGDGGFRSPILSEIMGIKKTISILYSQTAVGCSAKNNGA